MAAVVVLELALSARHQLSHEWAFWVLCASFLAVTTSKLRLGNLLLGKQDEEESAPWHKNLTALRGNAPESWEIRLLPVTAIIVGLFAQRNIREFY
ncbi:hypothetical protein GGI43DRAFT_400229 [Trichoderma evansii]